MKKLVLSGLVALSLGTTAALAQTPMNFVDVDTDGNGELGYSELQAAWPDLTQDEFSTADIDGSGGLTPDELSALQPSGVPSSGGTGSMAPAAEEAPASSLSP